MFSDVADLPSARGTAARDDGSAPPAPVVRFLADDLPVALVEVGAGGILTNGNSGARQLLGYDPVGRCVADVVYPEDYAGLVASFEQNTADNGEWQREFRVLHADGFPRWVRSHARIHFDDRVFVRAVTTWTDITAEVAAREASARFGELLETVEDVVAIVDPDGGVLQLNLAGRILFEDEATAHERIRLSDLFTPDSAQEINDVALPTVRHFGSWKGEVMMMPPDLEPRVVLLSLVSHVDAAGKVYLSAMTRDITELKAAEEALRRQATTDVLTGLPNRAILFDRVRHALSRGARTGGGVALLFVDLDRFKAVNDQLGHEAGDELLVQVAQRLLTSVRDCDTVARLGGDEFVVLAEPIIRFEDAKMVADRIVRSLSDPFELAAGTARIGASVGLAVSERDSTPRALLKKADTAVYRAKAQGRSRVVVAE